jgi:hypothetical protein
VKLEAVKFPVKNPVPLTVTPPCTVAFPLVSIVKALALDAFGPSVIEFPDAAKKLPFPRMSPLVMSPAGNVYVCDPPNVACAIVVGDKLLAQNPAPTFAQSRLFAHPASAL